MKKAKQIITEMQIRIMEHQNENGFETIYDFINEDLHNLLQLINNNECMTDVTSSPLQLCPKCNGQGTVSKPPWVGGDVTEWTSSATSFTCDVCNGAKVI